jgi:hypothetical protein
MKNKNKKIVIAKLKTDGLALALSQILCNRNLPAAIYNGIMRGLCDVENESASAALEAYTRSPEYLKKLFADTK